MAPPACVAYVPSDYHWFFFSMYKYIKKNTMLRAQKKHRKTLVSLQYVKVLKNKPAAQAAGADSSR